MRTRARVAAVAVVAAFVALPACGEVGGDCGWGHDSKLLTVDSGSVETTVGLRWQAISPVVAGDKAYVYEEAGALLAEVDLHNGDHGWEALLGFEEVEPLVLASGVLLASGRGERGVEVVAVDSQTGDTRWERGDLDDSFVSARHVIVIANGAVESLEPKTGERRWTVTDTGLTEIIGWTRGTVVAREGSPGPIVGISDVDGSLLWRDSITEYAVVFVYDGGVISWSIGIGDDVVRRVDASSGALVTDERAPPDRRPQPTGQVDINYAALQSFPDSPPHVDALPITDLRTGETVRTVPLYATLLRVDATGIAVAVQEPEGRGRFVVYPLQGERPLVDLATSESVTAVVRAGALDVVVTNDPSVGCG